MPSRTVRAAGFAALAALVGAGPAAAQTRTRTLQEALALTYANNPTIQAARAQLRATDENVSSALSGWRPQLVFTGQAGIYGGFTSQVVKDPFSTGVSTPSVSADRASTVANLGLTQPIYSGGRVKANTNRAENQVLSTRAQLMATEQQVFTDTINAFVSVIADQQLLQLDISNEQLLTRQLQATNDRFRVGELTRTDVAQAEAALASATATRQTAEGTLESARATYEQLVGEVPGKLMEPQPLQAPVKSLDDAKAVAARNNPNVVSALFAAAAAKDAFDVAYSALLPVLNVQASAFRNENQTQVGIIATGGSVLANLSIPIYQGGAEYAAIRQARQQEQQTRKQLEEQRRTAVQQATSSWEQMASARAAIVSQKAAVRANLISVEGVEREALVGSATTLDVLTAVQNLLNAETAQVQALANLVNASYQEAAAVGRLTARDLNLQVPLYDDKAYYRSVRDLWIGTGDYATDQPGR